MNLYESVCVCVSACVSVCACVCVCVCVSVNTTATSPSNVIRTRLGSCVFRIGASVKMLGDYRSRDPCTLDNTACVCVCVCACRLSVDQTFGWVYTHTPTHLFTQEIFIFRV